jgi:hypothetical protein
MSEESKAKSYESILFTDDDGNDIELFILEETVLAGESFLLVSDSDPDSDEAEVMVLRKVEDDGDEVCYVPVDDDNLLKNVLGVFEELLDDTGFEY